MPARPSDAQHRPYDIAIVGNDMLLAALPGRAIQFAHATLAAGFDLVVPVSWGEELLARRTLHVLEQPGPRPQVFCACPLVRRRLLTSGHELAPHLLSLVAPPVATARYLRALQPNASIRITYLGGCEAARDASIDRRLQPADFLLQLDRSGISISAQPLVFESTIPPDRRRHWSQPGGIPTAEALGSGTLAHTLLVIETGDLVAEIADHLLTSDRMLIDVAPTLGCMCAGAVGLAPPAGGREGVVFVEPPRSQLPVVDPDVRVDLDEPLPPRRDVPDMGAIRPHVVTESDPRGTDVPSHPATERAPTVPVDRRRFAVTPPHVGELARPERSSPSGDPVHRGSRAVPATARAATPTPVPRPGREPAPAPEAAAGRRPADPGSASAGPPPQVTTSTPPAATPTPSDLAAMVEPLNVPPHRTPAQELRRVVVAHARKQAGHRPTPLRAYAAFRPHRTPAGEPSGSMLVSVPDERPARTEPPPPSAGATPITTSSPGEPAPVTGELSASPSDLHRARRSKRTTPAPAPGVQRPRRLWGLLLSLVLIAAIGVLLFVMLRG